TESRAKGSGGESIPQAPNQGPAVAERLAGERAHLKPQQALADRLSLLAVKDRKIRGCGGKSGDLAQRKERKGGRGIGVKALQVSAQVRGKEADKQQQERKH